MKKALIVLSGGQDSTTCLYYAKRAGYELHAVTFDYAQRHARELDAARTVARMAGCLSHEVLQLGRVLVSTSPLVSGSLLEQYADHYSLPGGIEKTFVPLRNQLFLTLAANRAVALGANTLFTGVCEEDYGGYPDCREVYIRALNHAINLSNEGAAPELHIETPLMHLTKAGSVRLACELPGCYEALAYSHTAYDGAYPPTGKDHATLLRAKGFEKADIPDPLVLRAAVCEQRMPLPETENYHWEVVEEYLPLVECARATVAGWQ